MYKQTTFKVLATQKSLDFPSGGIPSGEGGGKGFLKFCEFAVSFGNSQSPEAHLGGLLISLLRSSSDDLFPGLLSLAGLKCKLQEDTFAYGLSVHTESTLQVTGA